MGAWINRKHERIPHIEYGFGPGRLQEGEHFCESHKKYGCKAGNITVLCNHIENHWNSVGQMKSLNVGAPFRLLHGSVE